MYNMSGIDVSSKRSKDEVITLSELYKAYEEKEFMDHLLNHIGSLIFVAGRDNRFKYVNDAVSKKYHYSKKELLTMTISEIDINFNLEKMDEFWEIFALKKSLHLQSVHKDKVGKLHPVLIHTHYIEFKNQVYAFGVVENQSYVQKLLDAHKGLITLTDGNNLLMTNSQTLKYFGYADFNSFKREHNCLCEFYIDEDGFISNTPQWLENVRQIDDAKVKIKKVDSDTEHIFLVQATTFDDSRTLITYTDITHMEKNKNMLETLAITDGLTILYNRRYFNQILPKEINRTKREFKHFAFIMLDIDFFKQYNDMYGHLKGDDVLIEIALTLKKYFNRASDYCFRLGGEEFGIFYRVDSFETIHQHAEQLRQEIEYLKIEHKGSSVSSFVTVSIGVTICEGSKTAEALYSKVDAELYKAKNSGRNRVSINLSI